MLLKYNYHGLPQKSFEFSDIAPSGPTVFKLPPLPEPVVRSERKFERISDDEYEYYGSGDFIDPFSEDDMYTNYEDLGSKLLALSLADSNRLSSATLIQGRHLFIPKITL